MKFALKHLKLAMAGVAMMSTQVLADTHFLIPGGPGGGWDTTARAVGEALVKSGLESNASFQNMSGGGGGRAIAYLIESGNKKGDMLMVNSTPIVLRALSGKIPYSYRDLTPVASVIADYGAFVVRDDSPFKSWKEVIARLEVNPGSVTVAGGSARGSMDHLVAAQAVKAAGVDVAVAISGIAGPGGGSEEKPVGTVWFAWGARGEPTESSVRCFDGDRDQVRRQAVLYVLQGVTEFLRKL